MLRQYGPQRHRNERLPNGRDMPVGTIPIGTTFRMVTSANGARTRVATFIVEAWLPRRIGAGSFRNADGCRTYADAFVARGGHLASVRCLANGRVATLADHIVRRWVDLDVLHVMLPVPPTIPERMHHRFLVLRTGEGTYFDV